MGVITLGGMDPGIAIAIIAICGGFAVAIISIVGGLITKMQRTRQVENSRREIAAYIAEGSMTPEDGKRILEASPSARS